MTLTAALIGLGQIGMGFEEDHLRAKPCTHLGALKTLGHEKKIELAAFFDTDLNKAAAAARYMDAIGSPVECTGFDQFKEQAKGVDIIAVATPEDTHYALLVEALKLKPRLIFCEKALANNSADAYLMQDLCRQLKVSLCVNHTRRWEQSWIDAKRTVDSGGIGAVQHLIGFYTGDKWRVGSHLADLVNWFGCGGKHTVIRLGVPYLLFETHIIGDQGRLTVCDNGHAYSIGLAEDSERYSGVKELKLFRAGGYDPEARSPKPLKTPMLRTYENIIRHLENGEPLACDGSMGVEAVRLVEKWT